MPAVVRVVFDHLPTVAPATARVVDTEVRSSAFRIQAGAMAGTPVVTGTLRRGWAVRPTRGGYEVYNPVNYAAYVEWGTRRMAPRGMLTQAVAQEIPRLSATLGHAIRVGFAR